MKRLLGLLVCSASLLAQAGEPVRFAYTSNDLDASLARYAIDPASGMLRFMDYLPLGKNTPETVVDPSGRFLLAPAQSINRLFVYRIDPQDGSLDQVPGSPFSVKGRGPLQITFHPSGRFFYIALRFSGVGAYAFDPQTGVVTALPDSPYPAQERTRAVALTPDGRRLYALNTYADSISAYAVDDQSGVLRSLRGFPIRVGDDAKYDYSYLSQDIPETAHATPYHMLVDKTGHFVLVANLAGSTISVFRIQPQSGHLSPVPGSPFFAGANPTSLVLHPNGRFVYAMRSRDSVVGAFALDTASGRLSEISGSPFDTGGQGVAEMAFSNQGRGAYAINRDSNDVAQLDVDPATGALTVREVVKTRSGPWSISLAKGEAPLAQRTQVFAALGAKGLGHSESADLSKMVPLAASASASALALTPDQRLLYAVDAASDTLTAWRVDEKATLTPIANGQVATGRAPSDVVIDRNGWYAYVTNAGDGTLSVYYIDEKTGQPKPVNRSPFKTGQRSSFISLDPAARYAYVVNSDDDTVSVYRYRSNVSPLIFESIYYGSPYPTGRMPAAIEIDPTGRYAYVANAGSNDVSAYHIHHQTGALVALPGSPFKAGRKPQALLTHPSGRWLFVANGESRDISVFRIEGMLGALDQSAQRQALPFTPGRLYWDAVAEQLLVLADDGKRWLALSVDPQSGALSPAGGQTLKTPVRDLRVLSRPAS